MSCDFPIYQGQLKGSKAHPEAKRAYCIYQTQLNKCRNPNVREFGFYGAKGIRVCYSAREFVSWWIFNLSKNKWVSPTTGRIDHAGNYSLDNIVMQERSENAGEAWKRLGDRHGGLSSGRRVEVSLNGIKHVFASAHAAARFLNIDGSNVSRFCRGELSPRNKNLRMRYMDDLRTTPDACS